MENITIKKTYYEILEVPKRAIMDEINEAFESKMDNKKSQVYYNDYQYAQAVLTNPILRKKYDEELAEIYDDETKKSIKEAIICAKKFPNVQQSKELIEKVKKLIQTLNEALIKLHSLMKTNAVLLGLVQIDSMQHFNKYEIHSLEDIYNNIRSYLEMGNNKDGAKKNEEDEVVRYATLETFTWYIEKLPKELQKIATVYALLADLSTALNFETEIKQVIEAYNYPLSEQNIITLREFTKGNISLAEINFYEFEDLPLVRKEKNNNTRKTIKRIRCVVNFEG